MKAYFAEVLACEAIGLAGVTDGKSLIEWRRCLVEKLMVPHSPYAKAMRQTTDDSGRSDFLHEWHDLIVAAVGRLRSNAGAVSERSDHVESSPCEAQRTAVLILAALYGGSVLSQISGDPRHLDAALDLALRPLMIDAGAGATPVCATSQIRHVEP